MTGASTRSTTAAAAAIATRARVDEAATTARSSRPSSQAATGGFIRTCSPPTARRKQSAPSGAGQGPRRDEGDPHMADGESGPLPRPGPRGVGDAQRQRRRDRGGDDGGRRGPTTVTAPPESDGHEAGHGGERQVSDAGGNGMRPAPEERVERGHGDSDTRDG